MSFFEVLSYLFMSEYLGSVVHSLLKNVLITNTLGFKDYSEIKRNKVNKNRSKEGREGRIFNKHKYTCICRIIRNLMYFLYKNKYKIVDFNEDIRQNMY